MNELQIKSINLLSDKIFYQIYESMLECDCKSIGGGEYVSEFDIEINTKVGNYEVGLNVSGNYCVSGEDGATGDEQSYFEMTGRWMNSIDVSCYLDGEAVEMTVNGLDIAKEIELLISYKN